MMQWKAMAQRRLLDYETMKKARESLPAELARCKKPGAGEDPLDVIARKLFLRERLRQVKRWITVTEKALSALDPQERLVVQLLYIMPKKGNVGRLCGMLGCEQSTVYRRRDRALQKFTVALYGKGN